MEDNITVTAEEAVEQTEEIVERSHKGIKVAAGIGLGVLAGVIVYRFVIKPIAAKIKARKELEAESDGTDSGEEDE